MRDPKLKIVITADGKQYSAALNRATGQTKALGSSAKTTAASVNLLQGALKLVGAYLTIQGARALINTADRVHSLETRVRTATKASGDFTKTWKELGAISVSTGAELRTTVSVFQGLARSAPELGATNTQMLELTKTVQQLGVISGASTVAMRAGLLQFSQGLASGVFRAEEFNSLLENLPEVAVRIANGLGVSVGELRKMVLAGRLASEDVFRSLIKQSGQINAEFGKIPLTVERSASALKTTLGQAIADLDKEIGSTAFLAKFLQGSTNLLVELSNQRNNGEQVLIDRRNRLRQELNNAIASKAERKRGGQAPSPLIDNRITQKTAELKIVEDALKARRSELLNNRRAEFKKETEAKRAAQLESDAKALEQEGSALTDRLALDAEANLRIIDNQRKVAKEKNAARQLDQQREEEALVRSMDRQAASRLNERDARIQAAQDAFEIMRNRFSSERELADRNYQRALAAFKRFEDEKTGTAIQRLELRERAERNYAQRIQQINERQFAAVERTGTDTFLSLRNAVDGWSRSFADALLQGGQGFTGFVDTVVQQLARIAIAKSSEPVFNGFAGFLEKVLTGTAQSLFSGGAFAGGFGPASGSFRAAQTLHTGGIAGVPTATRRVSNDLYLGAPRYHSGGLAGDEVPAILRRGEEVLTRSDPRHRTNLGQGGQVRVEIVNRGTPKEVQTAVPRFDPTGMVVRIIQDDVRRGGPISRTLGAT